MTEGVWLAVITGIPTTLAVVLSAMVQMRQAHNASTTIVDKFDTVAAETKNTASIAATSRELISNKLDDVASKTVATSNKTDEVHSLVNGRLTDALAEIARLRIVIEEFKDAINIERPKGKGGAP